MNLLKHIYIYFIHFLFVMINFNTSHCALVEDSKTQQQSKHGNTSDPSSDIIKNKYKVSVGPNGTHATDIHQTCAGIFIMIEKYNEDGEYSSTRALDVETGALHVKQQLAEQDKQVNDQLETMLREQRDSSAQSFQLSDSSIENDGGFIMSYLKKTLSNVAGQVSQPSSLISSIEESISPVQANHFLEMIDVNWDSLKADAASRAMTSLDHFYGSSPLESKEFENLFDTVMSCWSLMFILNIVLTLWLFCTFFFQN